MTDWMWCYENPREAAAKIDTLERMISEHNAGCVEACAARGSRRCDAYTSRAMRCPDCPRDWMIETPP
jgi:hypothetical protein